MNTSGRRGLVLAPVLVTVGTRVERAPVSNAH